jgi:MYXO-CTERM domain-containing protein
VETRSIALFGGALALTISSAASAAIFNFTHESGLAAEAEFTLVSATQVEIRVRNRSTGTPEGYNATQQLLSGISFDIGLSGAFFLDPLIGGGNVAIGENSTSVNFDSGVYTDGYDVSGEYGYSNSNGSGHMQNFISSAEFGGNFVAFGGENLDGPTGVVGPEGGLVSVNDLVPLGDTAAIRSEIVANITLTLPAGSIDDIVGNGVRISFGDPGAAETIFLDGVAGPLPAPAALSLLGLAGLTLRRRRR